jgi:ABC-type transport system involved in cytochrome bd biosynthesis fused ATPase/permease subunit
LAGPVRRTSAGLRSESPVFTDYDVSIEIDRFFGKHAAILGNTGAGKSCTVTALLSAVLD